MYPLDALYARQSLDKKDSISIESQLDFCKYETRGGKYETYVDKGFSGKNINRPDFERMIKDIKAKKIKRVIVYKLDRISRSILDFSNMMEIFQKYNVEFVSSTEKFDTSTPIGRAMLNICIVFAQLERETIQKRVADAYNTKSQKGFYMGGRVPFGFQLEKVVIDGSNTSKFVSEPREIEQIKLIYSLYAKPDMTLGKVLKELLNHGFTEKRGATWCTARVSEILKNPVYVKADMNMYSFFKSQGSQIINEPSDFIGINGIFLYKGSHGDKTKKKQYDLVDREVVIAPHEGVIDSVTWLKCRFKIMNNRQSTLTNKGKRTWLSGKVKCKKCGYAYTIIKSRAKAGRYFQCSGIRYSIRCKGSGYTIYADVFEDYIFKEIRKGLEAFQYLSEEPEPVVSPSYHQHKVRIAEIEKEIKALLVKIADANHTLMSYVNNRVDELDAEKQKLQKKVMEWNINKRKNNMDKITNHMNIWEKLSLEDKQQIADILIKVIYIDTDIIEMEWNI